MIRTRAQDEIFGHGPYAIRFEFEELELIAALTSMVVLGRGRPYREAAFNIQILLEKMMGDPEFAIRTLENMSPTIDILDSEMHVVDTHDAFYTQINV